MQGKNLILALATGTTGLVAGLYYGFEVAINPAFARLADRPYIEAMQRINVAIVNPLFALGFFGAPLLLPLAAGLHRRVDGRRFWLLAAATGTFWVGSLGVTVGANVPLNDQLAAFSVSAATTAQAAAARAAFAGPWNGWHSVRTVASIAALGLALAACLVGKRGGIG
ncbi:MAG TPA: anthrone oxygenase family protein [Hymenobacter sp.]|jgi:uncharacterized membrane protein|uniref:anthrone oxygenase family protein n=1 Tax=Hymenobacter sp. TaxID=1898978 RepID=UPI002ED97456